MHKRTNELHVLHEVVKIYLLLLYFHDIRHFTAGRVTLHMLKK